MRQGKEQRNYLASGMTLIEIMIVVAIIGGMMALGVMILFRSDVDRVQDDASRLAGTIKYVYNEAAIKGQYFRIVFNLEDNSYRVESSTEPFFATREEEDKKGENPEESPEASPAFIAEEGSLIKPVKLSRGIKFKDITVLHNQDRRETGVVHAYFFPNGWAEPLVVNLSDQEEEVFYSLEVNPLTGKVKIRPEYFQVSPEFFKTEETL